MLSNNLHDVPTQMAKQADFAQDGVRSAPANLDGVSPAFVQMVLDNCTTRFFFKLGGLVRTKENDGSL